MNKYENNEKIKINNSSGIYVTVYIASCLLLTLLFLLVQLSDGNLIKGMPIENGTVY